MHIFVDQAVEDRFSADLLYVDVGQGDPGTIAFVVGDVLRDALVRHGCGAGSCWLGAFAWRLCLLVCAGQAVLRTMSVAVRVMGRLDARGHGHIADSGGAVNAERQRLHRSTAMS